MAYTISKLAKMSKVSVRTLHWYDEIGLLKPAYYSANGYRHYEQEQLLLLQQILFFRELGFELKHIQKILKRSDFDKQAALHSHREILLKDLERVKKLIKTIDHTIEHLQGSRIMKDQEIYSGFDKEKQKEYQKYLINRYGKKAEASIAECDRNLKNWTKSDFEESKKEATQIIENLAKVWKSQKQPSSKEAQLLIKEHYEWLKTYWTPDKGSYIQLGEMYVGLEWKPTFEAYDYEHPKLAQFMADAIKIFAENELS